MQPSAESFVPTLGYCMAAGLVLVLLPDRMLSYVRRFYSFFRFPRALSQTWLTPTLARAMGVLFIILAAAMLVAYLRHWRS